MKPLEHAVYQIGALTLVPSERLLLRGGAAVPMTGRAFDLLVELVRNAGHLVTKDELLARVWPGVVVEEVNLSVNMSAVRKALGEELAAAIETVPRQGYRLNAPVEIADVATLDLAALRGHGASYRTESAHATPAVRAFWTRRRVVAISAGSVLLAAAGAAGYRLLHPEPGIPTDNAEAYQAYLQGRFLWNQRSESGLTRSVAHFQRAIQLDPGFALAYAALADAHTTLGYLGYVTPVSTFPVARPYALKALELDPALAAAHAALAYIKFYFDWDWAGAREEFRRALDLVPGDPVAHQWHAVYLLAAGRPGEAFDEIQAAHRLDPLSLAINTDIGFHHYYNRRYAEAERQLKSVLEMKPDFLLAHLWLARTYQQVGRFDDALAESDQARGEAREWPVILAARGFTLGTAGRAEEARAVLRRMEELAPRRFVTAYGMALVHTGLGDKDAAFNWLAKAFEERSHWLVWIRLDPRWDRLRDNPRFPPLVARMKYPA